MDVKKDGVIHFKDWSNSHIPEILQEIYLQRIYHPYVINKKDAVFFDLGLNIGLWSLYASQYAKKIYSFEPAKESYDLAVKNLKDNKATNVEAFQKAVAPTEGEMTFYHSTNSTMNSLKPEVNNTQTSETVATIRLDTFCKEHEVNHIDFMKVDVEGSEAELFTSESFKNIVPFLDAFVYEWHQWASANPNVLNYGLMNYGYTIKQIPSAATLFICQK